MSPEILNRIHYNQQTDIYSFALTMLEIMIWDDAFPREEYRWAWDIADYVAKGKRPKGIEKISNSGMKQLIQLCWQQEAKDRLTINEVVGLLETELFKLEEK